MGHYLSDMLPDPHVVCKNCGEGIYNSSELKAWGGLLLGCICKASEPQEVKCSYADRYEAKRPPKCGCLTCETKWEEKNDLS